MFILWKKSRNLIMENLSLSPFSAINLSDPFFDSLKNDYIHGFIPWFEKKSQTINEKALILRNESNNLEGFLYLKFEDGIDSTINPPLLDSRRMKVGTFKFESAGTLRGQRFLKYIFDTAVEKSIDHIYVTIFPKHTYLIKLFEEYGFQLHGTKQSDNGIENVYIRPMKRIMNGIVNSYPYIHSYLKNKYLLSIYPEFHTRLFPDSILSHENSNIIKDISHSNSIHKIYICAMSQVMTFKEGDVILIYRTSDGKGPARFRSVATSLCVIESVQTISSYKDEASFINDCKKYSVFTIDELTKMYKSKRYPYVIKFMYNAAFHKKITRNDLINIHHLDQDSYWGCLKLNDKQFQDITQTAKVSGLIRNIL